MTLNANNPAIEDDDLNTTAPQSPPDAWKMPEPVFRKTSGKLPPSFVKDAATSTVSENSTPPNETGAQELPPVGLDASPAKPNNPTLKVILVLLGLAAMIAFLIVFLSVIYFFIF